MKLRWLRRKITIAEDPFWIPQPNESSETLVLQYCEGNPLFPNFDDIIEPVWKDVPIVDEETKPT